MRYAALFAAVWLTAAHASAQESLDLDQPLEQTLGPDGEGPIVFEAHGDLAEVDALLARGSWEPAATRLLGIIELDREDRPLAEQRLAAALVELGQLSVARRLLGSIAAHEHHPGRRAALAALARLAPRLREGADVGDALASYSVQDLARLSAQPALRSRAAYLAGRSLYRHRRDDEAAAMLAEVGVESRWFPRAQLFLGMISVRDRHGWQAAARAFQAGLAALDQGEIGDLLKLSLARLFYSASLHQDDGVTIDAVRLNAAVKWWREIPEDSPYWFTAQFEQAWAYFMAGDYAHSMGLLQTVQSPYFEDRFVAEADVLRAITYFVTCHYDNTTAVAARSQREVARLHAEVDEVRREADELPERLRHGLRHGSARLRSLFDAVRNAPRIAGYRRQATALRREHRAVRDGAIAPALRLYLMDELEQGAREARRRELALARKALQDELDALHRVERDDAKLLIDVVSAERALLEESSGSYTSIGEFEYVIEPDREHVIWPFDGEYWRDELGSYRVLIRDQCRR